MYMKKICTLLLSLLLVFIIAGCVTPSETDNGALSGEQKSEGTLLPLDPLVSTGVLDNGLTWYVRKNSEPENRASLRLVVNAGSVLEEADQQGLAHFCEHMAFNGTEHFEKSALVDYLESIGMAFGPEINAYTSFDETVYMLEIPTDDDEIIHNAFQVLEDWAHLVSYEDEEIELERGVIQEEWRLGRGASGRIMDKLIPALFKGSEYAERLPIGKIDVVMNAPAQRLRDFYEKWYRPELMSVVVVGDIEPEYAEELVKQYFSFEAPETGYERPVMSIPVNTEDSVCLIPDPELPYASVEISAATGAPASQSTDLDYRRMLLESITWTMFNSRLDEAARSPEPPFIGAGGGTGSLVRASESVSCYASADTDSVEAALSGIVTELERAGRYGFTSTELDRTKADYLRNIEKYYRDRDNLQSSGFARELVDYYLEGVFMPGIAGEYELYQRFVPSISLEEINAYASMMMPAKGRLVTVAYPEGASVPSEDELLAILEAAPDLEIEAYVDEQSQGELVSEVPVPGAVESAAEFPESGAVLLHLSNGADVVLKDTEFREDEILFSAFSHGGLSLVTDEDFISGRYAPLLQSQSGLGEFDAVALQKKLAGTTVKLSPYIASNSEGFTGSFSPEESKTFFELLYLYFEQPLFDEAVRQNLSTRLESIIENRKADPSNVFYDRVGEILTNNDFRNRPLDSTSLPMFQTEAAARVYADRFSGADDFVFVFTGNLHSRNILQEILTYVGGLPAGNPEESAVDLGVRAPQGIISEKVVKGLDPQSRVVIVFSGELDQWDENTDLQLDTAASVMETILRERIREQLSGTYHIAVSASLKRVPAATWQVSINFGCEPERADELAAEIFSTISDVSAGTLDENYILRQEEQYRRAFEKEILENSYWLDHLETAIAFGDDPDDQLTPEEFRDKISAESIVETVEQYFTPESYVMVELLPEAQE